LKDVLAEFEKQYNINVTDASNNTLKFTGAFEHDNIENALKSITQPLNLTYTIENNQKVIISNVQN
jgi:transmembrane sensor